MTTLSFTIGDPIAKFIRNYVEQIDSMYSVNNQLQACSTSIEKFITAGFLAVDVFIPKFLAENGHYYSRAIHVEALACACHATNRAYCRSIGDDSQQSWEEAPEWQRASMIQGVHFRLENLDATPEQQHEVWMLDKEKDGWKYGPVKNPVKKEHPCLVPYKKLPAEQQVKDQIFTGILRREVEREQNVLSTWQPERIPAELTYGVEDRAALPKGKDLFTPGQTDARQTDAPEVSPGAALFRPRYRKLSEDELALHDALKNKAGELADLFYQVNAINAGHFNPQTTFNVQLAIRHLEDAVMRAVKALTA